MHFVTYELQNIKIMKWSNILELPKWHIDVLDQSWRKMKHNQLYGKRVEKWTKSLERERYNLI